MKQEIRLLPYQNQIRLSKVKRKGLIGSTGIGKTFFVPIYTFLFMAQNPCSTIIISSPSLLMMKRTVIPYLQNFFISIGISETNQFEKISKAKYYFNRSDNCMRFYDGSVLWFVSATDSNRMQGIHADLIIGDEAGLYFVDWFNTAVQRLAFKGGEMLLTTTLYPNTGGWIINDFMKEFNEGNKDYFILRPKSRENPYYPLAEIERAKRDMPRTLFEIMFESAIPDVTANQLFSLQDIRFSFNLILNKPTETETVITCDVAGEGDDFSQIKCWHGYREVEKLTIEENTQPELERILKVMSDKYGKCRIILDSTGIGTAVGQYLRESDYNCDSVNFAESAYQDDIYRNTRAEMYFNCQREMKNGNVSLLEDEELEEELRCQRYKICPTSRRFMIVPKEEIKKELKRSPDKADAVALRFYPKREFGFIM
jgi:hypothetical protein